MQERTKEIFSRELKQKQALLFLSSNQNTIHFSITYSSFQNISYLPRKYQL